MIKTLYKKFQSWSEKGSVYIISDLHLLDEDMCWRWKLIKDCPLSWSNLNEEYISEPLAEYIVNKINCIAHKPDCLVVLGDIGDVSYIKELKAGYKVLIKGNHDIGTSKYEDYFDEVYEGPLFISEKIILSHEPMNWPYALNIHGHVHDLEYKDSDKEITLCCEKIGFTPISLSDIIKSGKLKNIDSIHRDTINKAIERKKLKK